MSAFIAETLTAVRVSAMKADMVLNSKSEWHQAPLIRVIPVSGLLGEQEGSRRRRD